MWNDKDIQAKPVRAFVAGSKEECFDSCLADDRCKVFSFDSLNRWGNNCWLKETAESVNDFSGIITGVKCKSNTENAPQSFPDKFYSPPEIGSCLILEDKKNEILSNLRAKSSN